MSRSRVLTAKLDLTKHGNQIELMRRAVMALERIALAAELTGDALGGERTELMREDVISLEDVATASLRGYQDEQ